MPENDRLRSLLKELRKAKGPDAVTRLAQDRGTLFLGTPGSASMLISDRKANAEARLTLFTLLLDQARMNMENRGRLGAGFLSEAEEAIAGFCGSGSLDLDTGVSLVRAYAIAELEVPEALVSALMKGAGTPQSRRKGFRTTSIHGSAVFAARRTATTTCCTAS